MWRLYFSEVIVNRPCLLTSDNLVTITITKIESKVNRFTITVTKTKYGKSYNKAVTKTMLKPKQEKHTNCETKAADVLANVLAGEL